MTATFRINPGTNSCSMNRKIIYSGIAIAVVFNAIFAFDSFRSRKEREGKMTEITASLIHIAKGQQEVTVRLSEESIKTQKRIEDLEAQLIAIKATQLPAPTQVSPKDLESLRGELADFKSAVTTHINTLVTTCNEHSKVLVMLNNRPTSAEQPTASAAQ